MSSKQTSKRRKAWLKYLKDSRLSQWQKHKDIEWYLFHKMDPPKDG